MVRKIKKLKVTLNDENISSFFPENDVRTEFIKLEIEGARPPYDRYIDPNNFGSERYNENNARPLYDKMYNIPVNTEELLYKKDDVTYMMMSLSMIHSDIHNTEDDDGNEYLSLSRYVVLTPTIYLDLQDSHSRLESSTPETLDGDYGEDLKDL